MTRILIDGVHVDTIGDGLAAGMHVGQRIKLTRRPGLEEVLTVCTKREPAEDEPGEITMTRGLDRLDFPTRVEAGWWRG